MIKFFRKISKEKKIKEKKNLLKIGYFLSEWSFKGYNNLLDDLMDRCNCFNHPEFENLSNSFEYEKLIEIVEEDENFYLQYRQRMRKIAQKANIGVLKAGKDDNNSMDSLRDNICDLLKIWMENFYKEKNSLEKIEKYIIMTFDAIYAETRLKYNIKNGEEYDWNNYLKDLNKKNKIEIIKELKNLLEI